MADNADTEVNQITHRVEVEPSKDDDDELVDDEEIENETQSDSSADENDPEEVEAEETEETEDETEETEETEEVEPEEPETPEVEIKDVPGETPKERALRLEVTSLKAKIRQQRADEIFVKAPNAPFRAADDPELEQYDPEELARFESLARKIGFVKKDDLAQQDTQDKNTNEFNTFMNAHPEYSPENDKDGLLWEAFRKEFALYQPPTDPATLRKVLANVHREVVGEKPVVKANLKEINASRQKIKVASHTGASATKTARPAAVPKSNGLRTDMMKGFSEEDMAELLAD